MPKALLIYHERLGDVLCCFPAAKALANKGYQVDLECKPEFHEIFGLIDYAKPVAPGQPRDSYDVVLFLQIYPMRLAEFAASGLNWREFVYQDPLIKDAMFPIQLDHTDFDISSYNLPQRYSLVIPYGVTGRPIYSPAWLMREAKKRTDAPIYVLAAPSHAHKPNHITAKHLTHLVTLLKGAEAVFTVNTAVLYLLSSVHKNWYLAPLGGGIGQKEWMTGDYTILRPSGLRDVVENKLYDFWDRKYRRVCKELARLKACHAQPSTVTDLK